VNTSSSVPPTFCFGAFELDPRAGELRKKGMKIKLQGQPAEILVMLLERPGETVTRDELQKKLWPADTFVDFEQGLNNAMNRLRVALDDDAESPHFIETVPRRGYRFVGVLNGGGQPVAAGAVPPASKIAWRPRFSWSVSIWLAVIGMAGLVLLISAVYRPRSPLRQTPRVSRYSKLTNDPLPKVVVNFPLLIQLLTNGPRIYYSQAAAGLDSIAEISSSGEVDGSTSSIRTSFRGPLPTGISPDGSQLLATSALFQWDQPLWVVSLPSGTSRRLGDLIGHDASWSPDGRTIVFAKNHDLYRTDIDGSTPEKLATLPNSAATFIRWSPDGTRLRFTITDEGNTFSSLWQISLTGGDLHRLFPIWGGSHPQECCGNWTADGRYFVFQATRGGIIGIWAVREEMRSSPTSNPLPVQLTSGPIPFTAPLPSKDGKQIFAMGEQLRGELTRFDPKSQRFVRYLSGISAELLSFSRDGQWVTYVTYPESVIWKSRIDGTQHQQLTVPPLQAAHPQWSPNGRQIAFHGKMPGEKDHLYVIPAEGGSPEAITTSSAAQPAAGVPTWSPDGNSVIFFELGEFGLDSTARILLLNLHTRQVSALPASEGLYLPRWSPDGRYVVALTVDNQKLMLFDFRARKWSELVNGSLVAWPEWSTDSKYVFYIADPPGSFDIDSLVLYSRVDINSHRVVRVANLEQTRGLHAGRYGTYYGVTPDGSPLFLRNTGFQEVYALDVDLP
jgi:Tol biopolymer transport system component/DNA-binding winged helix-turn-helix (wHTH) protein